MVKIKNLFLWFSVFFVSLLVMVQPVHASGSVAVSVTYHWAPYMGGWYSTPQAACDATLSYYGSNYHYNPAPSKASDTLWACNIWNLANTSSYSQWTAAGSALSSACPVNSTGTTTCTCNSGFVPSADAKSCVSDCPHTYLGIQTSGGYVFTANSNPSAYTGCDNVGCAVSVVPVGTVFGVTLWHNVPTANQCPNSNQPTNPPVTSLTVTFTSDVDPQKTNFDTVVQKAVALDSTMTQPAIDAATAAKAAVDVTKAALSLSAAAVQTAIAAQTVALQALQAASNNLMASPTAVNLTTYNNAVTSFNTSNSTVTTAITKLKADYSVASNAVTNAQAASDNSAAVNQKLVDLQVSITASGQAFDAAQVAAKTANAASLNTIVGTAVAALAAANTVKAAATTIINNSNTSITNNNTIANDTNASVQIIKSATPAIAAASSVVPTNPATIPVAPVAPAQPLTGASAVLDTSTLNKEATQQKIVDALDTTGAITDISNADIAKYQTAIDDMANSLTNLRALSTNGDPVPLDSSFFLNPFVPSTCAPLSYTFGGPLTAGAHTVTFDMCPQIPMIQAVFGWVLYLITAAIIFIMLMGM